MPEKAKVNRRQFLEKSGLIAAAASAASARLANGQVNNSAAVSLKPVRLGFIGVGIRGTLLMEAAAGIAGVELKAAADCYKGHLDRAQEAFTSALAVTGDYKELLARADVDAVVIATPDHWHLKMTEDALAAGKHVYVEKPMTHRWEEGEAFVAAAEKSGKVVQVGSQYMSMGCAKQASDFIKSGRLGQVTLVEGRFHRNSATGAWYYPIPPDASPTTVDWKSFLGSAQPHDFDLRRFFQWRLFWDYSGGLPTDLFVHLVTATHQLMGVQEQTLHFRYLLPENGGALIVARSLEEHLGQLRGLLAGESAGEGWREEFLHGFVRPHGLDRPVAPMLVEDLERFVGVAREPVPA